MIDIKNIKEMLDSKIITKEEYDVIVSRIQAPKTVDNYTWSDIVDGYYDYCCQKYTIITAKGYRTCIMKFVMYYLNNNDYDYILKQKFDVFTFQRVNTFISWMTSEGLSSHTIKKIKYAMIVLCDYLKSIGIDAPDITNINIAEDKLDNDNVQLLTKDEIYDIAEGADIRAKICILLCYEGAIKRQEIFKVRFQDFDYEKCQLNIYADDNFIRVCILNKQIIELVKTYKDMLYEDIEKWNKSRIKKGREIREDFGYIFQNIKTTTPSYPMLQTLLKNTAKKYYTEKGFDDKIIKSKVSNFTFETLRNSKRLYLLAQGYTVNQVMNIVGDKNYMSTCRFQKYVPMFYPDIYKSTRE